MSDLRQRNFFGNEQQFHIEGNKLKYHVKQKFYADEFTIDLADLEAEPRRYRKTPIMWILFLILSLIMDVVFLAHMISGKNWDRFWDTLSGIFFVNLFVVVSAWNVFIGWLDIIIFHGKGGEVVLWADNPTSEECDEFVNMMKSKIKEAKSYNKERDKRFIQLLRTEGIMDEWQYAKAIDLLEQIKE